MAMLSDENAWLAALNKLEDILDRKQEPTEQDVSLNFAYATAPTITSDYVCEMMVMRLVFTILKNVYVDVVFDIVV